MTVRSVAILVVVCTALVPRPARADALSCVQENNTGADKLADHHLLDARETYLACVSETECPPMVLVSCSEALAVLKTSIPTLLVTVVDEQQHELSGVTLTVDEHPAVLQSGSLEIDPGTHVLRATLGALSVPLEVVVAEEDRDRAVEIVLRGRQPDAKPAAPVSAPAPAIRAESRAKRSLVPSLVLGSVGVLGAASFSYFALAGHANQNELQQCKPYCNYDDVHRVHLQYTAADISLGVSVVSLAAAAYFLWRPRAEDAPHTGSRVSFDFVAKSGEAALSVRLAE